MIQNLLMLAQESSESHPLFNLRNLILVVAIIALLVGYKIYKNKTMS